MILALTQHEAALVAEVERLRAQVGRPHFGPHVVAAQALVRGLYDELDDLRFAAKVQRDPAAGEANLLREQAA